MHVTIVIIPDNDGFDVVVWGKWTAGSMRVRHFENRTIMIATLINLGLIAPTDEPDLEQFEFSDSCPLFSAEVDVEMLAAHGFVMAYWPV